VDAAIAGCHGIMAGMDVDTVEHQMIKKPSIADPALASRLMHDSIKQRVSESHKVPLEALSEEELDEDLARVLMEERMWGSD
jgi:hypothetical protein